jgi:RNA polymerase sigma-70 factor (ECF subfamily)
MKDPQESQSDNSLLDAAMLGDNKAFALFCQQALPKLQLHVSHLCSSYNLDLSLVGDFCNDTIVHAMDYIVAQKQLKSHAVNPIRNADAWLKTIASNIVIDFTRKVIHRQEQPLDSRPEVASPLTLGELLELENLFTTLSPRESQVVRLLYLEQLSVREVAEKLGITEEAVRKAHHRALQHLKDKLEED